MSFADQLRPHVERLGTSEAARIADVTPRSLQLWMRGPKEPCASMRDGVLLRLSQAHKVETLGKVADVRIERTRTGREAWAKVNGRDKLLAVILQDGELVPRSELPGWLRREIAEKAAS